MASNREVYTNLYMSLLWIVNAVFWNSLCSIHECSGIYAIRFLICSYVLEWRQVTLYKIQSGWKFLELLYEFKGNRWNQMYRYIIVNFPNFYNDLNNKLFLEMLNIVVVSTCTLKSSTGSWVDFFCGPPRKAS